MSSSVRIREVHEHFNAVAMTLIKFKLLESESYDWYMAHRSVDKYAQMRLRRGQ